MSARKLTILLDGVRISRTSWSCRSDRNGSHLLILIDAMNDDPSKREPPACFEKRDSQFARPKSGKGDKPKVWGGIQTPEKDCFVRWSRPINCPDIILVFDEQVNRGVVQYDDTSDTGGLQLRDSFQPGTTLALLTHND